MTTIAYEDFIDEVRNDLKEFIKDRWDEKEIKDLDRDEVYDEAFMEDRVTGNGSGSYFFNAWKAKESIFNMDEDLLRETISEFDIDMSEHWGDWEFLDVSVRCYALGQIDIDELLDEIRKEIGIQEDEICYFLKSDLLGMIAEIRDQFEEDGECECSHTIDFLDDGSMEIDAFPKNSWMACEQFNKEDMSKTDEELLQKAIKGATTYNENICFD